MTNINLEEAINNSIKIMINQKENSLFSQYDIGYFMTNEYIKQSLEAVRFNKDRALTILGSGDHVFNLAYAGVKTIDAIDINELEYFVYQLRYTMLQSISRKEFIYAHKLLTTKKDLSKFYDLIKQLKPNLPEDVYAYYCRMIEHCLRFEWHLQWLYQALEVDKLAEYNNYLSSDEAYSELRRKILETEINLHFTDAFLQDQNNPHHYDIIHLSNIADYLTVNKHPFSIDDLNQFLNDYQALIKEDGIIIMYLFSISFGTCVKGTRISPEDLGRENIFTVSPSNAYPEDGILLTRHRSVK